MRLDDRSEGNDMRRVIAMARNPVVGLAGAVCPFVVMGALIGVLIAAIAVLPFTAVFFTSARAVHVVGAVSNVAAAVVGSAVTRTLVLRRRARGVEETGHRAL